MTWRLINAVYCHANGRNDVIDAHAAAFSLAGEYKVTQ